ncbi:ankyrin repeat domain-containing protein [Ralstonia pickettii]|nr:ankyrin repeat domain-containing protein [Ralstonia pickettii]
MYLIILFILLLTACQSTLESRESLSKETQTKKKEENTMNQQLIDCAERGDTKKVLNLLKDGAEINATNEHGVTAVMAATQNHQTDTVHMLIQQGADINIRNNNQDNVLLYAGAEGFLDIVKLAVEAGADTTLTNRYDGTALIPASERGHVEVVKELLTHSDTDVNHINNLHWTALLEAIILGEGGKDHQKIVQLLVNHGADVNISDGDGVTPLQHAQNHGYREIVGILKEAGAQPKAPTW